MSRYKRAMWSDSQSGMADEGPRQVLKEFVRVAIPLLLLLILIFSGIHGFHYSFARNVLDIREKSYIRIGYEAIRNDIRVATSDLLHMAESKHMQDMLAFGSREANAHLAAEFESLLGSKRLYDQIRYLDETGMEVTRVNFNAGLPMVITDKKLQNKSHRYYFKETFRLDRRVVFVSPMDLNIENGRIERPIKPMLRFGTPVFDKFGQKRGILLVNYFADNIRRNIKQFLDNPSSETILLNAQGYWLIAPDKQDEWGFMFNNQRSFAIQYPDVWQEMARLKEGQFESSVGLFTFITIYPLLGEHAYNSGISGSVADGSQPMDGKAYFWILASHIPQAQLDEYKSNHIKSGAFQFGLVSLLVLPLAWQFSRERVKRKSAGRALERSEQYMHDVTSQLAEGLMVIDRKGCLTSMNKEAVRLLGWEMGELAGAGLNAILSNFPADSPGTDRGYAVVAAIEDGLSRRMDNATFVTKQGVRIPVSFSVAPLRYEGARRGAIITFRDISERLKMQAKLKLMATHDPLTGVKNRGEIERLLSVELERAQRYNLSLSILMLDVDHFKKINDTYGHQMGDTVLQAACSKFMQELRANDLLGRYGGEEFIVILPETDVTVAVAVAERLRVILAAMKIPVENQPDIRITVSVGVASYPESAHNEEQLVQAADAMLYRAKHDGRNCVIANQAVC